MTGSTRFSTAFSLRYLRAASNSICFFEGDRYTEDPDDHGGATKYGLTYRFLLAHIGPAAIHPRELTLEDALAIYWTYIWVPQRLEAITPGDLSAKLFDMMLPMGEPQAVRYFQRALNEALHGSLLSVAVDGVLGKKTLGAVTFAINAGRGRWVMERLIALATEHYAGIVQHDQTQAKYLVGWTRRAAYDPSRLHA